MMQFPTKQELKNQCRDLGLEPAGFYLLAYERLFEALSRLEVNIDREGFRRVVGRMLEEKITSANAASFLGDPYHQGRADALDEYVGRLLALLGDDGGGPGGEPAACNQDLATLAA